MQRPMVGADTFQKSSKKLMACAKRRSLQILKILWYYCSIERGGFCVCSEVKASAKQGGLREHGAGHYMDDYYVIFPSIEEAKAAAEKIIEKAESLGFTVNRNKSHIVPLTKPFRFCKAKFLLTETGRVVTHGCRDGMKRARRKLRSFLPKVQRGEMTLDAVKEFLQSQISYYQHFNDHGRVLKLRRLFYAMYGE